MRTPHRKLARPGLTYFEANRNRLVEIEGDVLDIKGKIRAVWPDVHFNIFYDDWEKKWVITQVGEDGTERLVLTADALDQRIIDRLHAGRPDREGNILDDLDKENAEIERANERRFENQVGDFGERFAHALRKDGFDHHDDIYGSRNNKKKRRRVVRNR